MAAKVLFGILPAREADQLSPHTKSCTPACGALAGDTIAADEDSKLPEATEGCLHWRMMAVQSAAAEHSLHADDPWAHL